MTILRILFVGLAVAVTITLMLPAVTRDRPAARRTQCKNNLRHIQLALANYESTYHAWPPAYTVDTDGKRLHSWRTLILPFLDAQKLYDMIDLSKPWDDPANERARNTLNVHFCCPANPSVIGKTPEGTKYTKTTYMAVVTPESCFLPHEARSLSDIEDARQETMVLIEVASEYAVHWMEPADADEKMVLNLGSDSKRPHEGGTFAAFADGSVLFLRSNLSQDTIRALISIAGHEAVGAF